jgi:hypothetical protein
VRACFGSQLAGQTQPDDPASASDGCLERTSKRSRVLIAPDDHWTQHCGHHPGVSYRRLFRRLRLAVGTRSAPSL